VEQCRFNQTNTQRTQVKGIANLQWTASDLSNQQSLTHTAVARGPIWLCAFGPAVLLGCTPLSYDIFTHYPGYFHSCWFDQALSCCTRRFCFCIFPSNRKRSTHCFTMRVSFHSWRRWTISTTSRYLEFFLFRKLKDFVNVFHMLLLFETSVSKDFWAQHKLWRISPFITTEVNPSFK